MARSNIGRKPAELDMLLSPSRGLLPTDDDDDDDEASCVPLPPAFCAPLRIKLNVASLALQAAQPRGPGPLPQARRRQDEPLVDLASCRSRRTSPRAAHAGARHHPSRLPCVLSLPLSTSRFAEVSLTPPSRSSQASSARASSRADEPTLSPARVRRPVLCVSATSRSRLTLSSCSVHGVGPPLGLRRQRPAALVVPAPPRASPASSTRPSRTGRVDVYRGASKPRRRPRQSLARAGRLARPRRARLLHLALPPPRAPSSRLHQHVNVLDTVLGIGLERPSLGVPPSALRPPALVRPPAADIPLPSPPAHEPTHHAPPRPLSRPPAPLVRLARPPLLARARPSPPASRCRPRPHPAPPLVIPPDERSTAARRAPRARRPPMAAAKARVQVPARPGRLGRARAAVRV